jgi:hypothetical protein
VATLGIVRRGGPYFSTIRVHGLDGAESADFQDPAGNLEADPALGFVCDVNVKSSSGCHGIRL